MPTPARNEANEANELIAASATPPGTAHRRQLALQGAAAFAVLSLAWPYFLLHGTPLPWPHTALAIGAAAFLLASLTRQTWWWRLIHTLFAPLAWAVSTLHIAPTWFLAAFLLLLLVYRGALAGQIPLYLSNKASVAALAELLPDTPGLRFIDLGAGLASVIAPLSRKRPHVNFSGIENAPASWLIGKLRCAARGNCLWRWGDLWQTDLGGYDIVYAFLSPAPMPALWEKVQREMRPGSLFVSNSFAVPGITPSEVVRVGKHGEMRLFCYRKEA